MEQSQTRGYRGCKIKAIRLYVGSLKIIPMKMEFICGDELYFDRAGHDERGRFLRYEVFIDKRRIPKWPI